MALELAPLRVNVIRPGIVDTALLGRLTGSAPRDDVISAMTKRVPLGRIAQPEEIAEGIIFLSLSITSHAERCPVDGFDGLGGSGDLDVRSAASTEEIQEQLAG